MICSIALCYQAIAQTHPVENSTLKVQQLQSEITELKSEVIKLWIQRNKQKRQIDTLTKGINTLASNIKTIDLQCSLIDNKFTLKTNKTITDINNINTKIQNHINHLNKQINQLKFENNPPKTKEHFSIYDSILGIGFTLIICVFYIILNRLISKNSSSVAELKAKLITDTNIDKKSFELLETNTENLNTLLKSILETKQVKSTINGEFNHSLVKVLVDRITFMQITLSKMDPKVRGYRQLSKSIHQMHDTLLANGYEVVEMLGLPYHEGMTATVSFVDDENLKVGERVITGIIKPQINYKGTVIQTAQITVSQNI